MNYNGNSLALSIACNLAAENKLDSFLCDTQDEQIKQCQAFLDAWTLDVVSMNKRFKNDEIFRKQFLDVINQISKETA